MEAESAMLDRIFAALGDPTRRAILARLAESEATVNELVAPFELSQPTISKHLKVLEFAGLVERGRHAQYRPVRLRRAALAEAASWLDHYRGSGGAELLAVASISDAGNPGDSVAGSQCTEHGRDTGA